MYIDVRTELTIICKKCGHVLAIKNERHKINVIQVEPCDKCRIDAYELGLRDGKISVKS